MCITKTKYEFKRLIILVKASITFVHMFNRQAIFGT